MDRNLYNKTRWMVQQARNYRAYFKSRGIPVGPVPTKAQIEALAAWAAQKERTLQPTGGVHGLGQAAQGAASGAATGASIGMVAGPWGAAVGAIVGGIGGAIMGRSQEKKAKEQAKKAIKAAKYQRETAEKVAAAQVKSANIVLEAEQVKARAAEKMPKWMWVALAAGGLVVFTGSIIVGVKHRKQA